MQTYLEGESEREKGMFLQTVPFFFFFFVYEAV